MANFRAKIATIGIFDPSIGVEITYESVLSHYKFADIILERSNFHLDGKDVYLTIGENELLTLGMMFPNLIKIVRVSSRSFQVFVYPDPDTVNEMIKTIWCQRTRQVIANPALTVPKRFLFNRIASK